MKPCIKALAVLALSATSASAQDWNVDVFAGAVMPNTLSYTNIVIETDAGLTYGIGISKSDVFVPNLEFGLEFSHSSVPYTGFSNSISGTATLATIRYNFMTSGAFEAYAGLGVGAVNVTYHAFFTNNEVVAGGQVMLGARYAISDRVKIFAEARYLDTFTDALVAGNPPVETAEFRTASVVLGVRSSF